MIKLVVFDWNGTLLADTQAIVEGANKEFAVLKRPPITVAQYREHYQIPLARYFKSFGITEEEHKAHSMEMAKAFHEYYEARVAKARTRRGTNEVLRELKKIGVSQVILSNHTLEGIYLQLERLKLAQYFDAVLANEVIDGAHFKGKKDRLIDYLSAHKIKSTQAVIVGDTEEEVYIGRELGMKTVAITGGHNSTKRLIAVEPDFLINKIVDLSQIIERLEQ
jgi:phosphoglycolate phosphatase-like HAD superfamily hydrolase